MATPSLLAACVPSTFSSALSVFGATVLSIDAVAVTNFSSVAPGDFRFTQPGTQLINGSFCNVTVAYKHPGQSDRVTVETWLPAPEDAWNGRLQAVGGGGWIAGRFVLSYAAMVGAVADGYATVTTDAGLNADDDPDPWALVSPGNVNLYALQNFGSVSLGDEVCPSLSYPSLSLFLSFPVCSLWRIIPPTLSSHICGQAIIAKALIVRFYGRPPAYSYWNGCSQGGRAGLMLAQRYPGAYDGIAAGSPAVYWAESFPSGLWAQHYMNAVLGGVYPRGCEIDAITAAAIKACDGLDGVVDGIVAEVDACLASFNPFRLVGTVVANCSSDKVGSGHGHTVVISKAAAAVVNATWHGPVSPDGTKQRWYGYSLGSDLTGGGTDTRTTGGQLGPAATNCTSGTCVGVVNGPWLEDMRLFLARGDPKFKFDKLTRAEFDSLIHSGVQRLSSLLSTGDADLSEFRDAGGKLVTIMARA